MSINYNDDKMLVRFANSNKCILLTKEQFIAASNRDLISFKNSGLNIDTYLSLIDPDYPVITTG